MGSNARVPRGVAWRWLPTRRLQFSKSPSAAFHGHSCVWCSKLGELPASAFRGLHDGSLPWTLIGRIEPATEFATLLWAA